MPEDILKDLIGLVSRGDITQEADQTHNPGEPTRQLQAVQLEGGFTDAKTGGLNWCSRREGFWLPSEHDGRNVISNVNAVLNRPERVGWASLESSWLFDMGNIAARP